MTTYKRLPCPQCHSAQTLGVYNASLKVVMYICRGLYRWSETVEASREP